MSQVARQMILLAGTEGGAHDGESGRDIEGSQGRMALKVFRQALSFQSYEMHWCQSTWSRHTEETIPL